MYIVFIEQADLRLLLWQNNHLFRTISQQIMYLIECFAQKSGWSKNDFNVQNYKKKLILTTVWHCLCSWCPCSPSRGRCPYKSSRRGRTCPGPGAHKTVAPGASHAAPSPGLQDCSSCTRVRDAIGKETMREVTIAPFTWPFISGNVAALFRLAICVKGQRLVTRPDR